MKRTQFIQTIIGLFGLGVLPVNVFKQYKKLYLLQFFVRGFQYYNAPQLLQQMKTGSLLQLVREPKNVHDDCAVALHYNNQKIGYVPAEENGIMSRLMDADVLELLAEITHLEPKAAKWENVCVAIYILKETSALPTGAAYLTTLDTPEYYTLKHNNHTVSRLAKNEKQIMSGDDFYEALVENGNNGIYDRIHLDIGSPEAMEEIVDESLLLVNRNSLPKDLKLDGVIQALDEGIVELDDAFDKKGYVVAQIDRVAKLARRIDQFTEVTDKEGRRFFEVVFA